MWWSAHPGTIGSGSLGKDEVPGSNPGISSREPVRNDWFFVVLGSISARTGAVSCKLQDLAPDFPVFVTSAVTFRLLKAPCNPVISTVFGLSSVSHAVSHNGL